jgi:hypothetical protein
MVRLDFLGRGRMRGSITLDLRSPGLDRYRLHIARGRAVYALRLLAELDSDGGVSHDCRWTGSSGGGGNGYGGRAPP